MTSKEVADGEGKPCQCVTFGDCGKSTTIRVDGDNEHAFTFDAVKGPDTRQADIYAEAAHSIVERVLQGYHGSVMTYGQSGTGKTHTMEGDLTTTGDASGLIGRSAHHLFSEMQPEVEAGTAVVKVRRLRDQIARQLAPSRHKPPPERIPCPAGVLRGNIQGESALPPRPPRGD